ncbi:33057_t:CDS:2, partial [Racocetra persica]
IWFITTSNEGFLWVLALGSYYQKQRLGSKLPVMERQFKTSDNNLSLSETSEIIEDIEINFLENEIWTEEEITKFELLYYKTKNILEKQDDDPKFEEEISLLQNNDFKELYEKGCCEKNCLQSNCDYSVAFT